MGRNEFCFVREFWPDLIAACEKCGFLHTADFANLTAKQLWEITEITEADVKIVVTRLHRVGLNLRSSREQEKVDGLFLLDLDLSVRAFNVLSRAGLFRVDEIAALSRSQLLQIHNLGFQTLKEIECCLNQWGISLCPDSPENLKNGKVKGTEEPWRPASDNWLWNGVLCLFDFPLRDALEEQGVKDFKSFFQMSKEEFLALPGASKEVLVKCLSRGLCLQDVWSEFDLFSPSARQVLQDKGISTVLECLKLSEAEFAALPGVQPEDVDLIKLALSYRDLCLEQ